MGEDVPELETGELLEIEDDGSGLTTLTGNAGEEVTPELAHSPVWEADQEIGGASVKDNSNIDLMAGFHEDPAFNSSSDDFEGEPMPDPEEEDFEGEPMSDSDRVKFERAKPDSEEKDFEGEPVPDDDKDDALMSDWSGDTLVAEAFPVPDLEAPEAEPRLLRTALAELKILIFELSPDARSLTLDVLTILLKRARLNAGGEAMPISSPIKGESKKLRDATADLEVLLQDLEPDAERLIREVITKLHERSDLIAREPGFFGHHGFQQMDSDETSSSGESAVNEESMSREEHSNDDSEHVSIHADRERASGEHPRGSSESDNDSPPEDDNGNPSHHVGSNATDQHARGSPESDSKSFLDDDNDNEVQEMRQDQTTVPQVQVPANSAQPNVTTSQRPARPPRRRVYPDSDGKIPEAPFSVSRYLGRLDDGDDYIPDCPPLVINHRRCTDTPYDGVRDADEL